MKKLFFCLGLLAGASGQAQTPLWDNDCHPDVRATYAVAFSADGAKVLSGSECDNAHVRIWNSATGAMEWDNDIGSALFCIVGVQLSANGSYFGVMEELGNVLVYDYTGAVPVLVHTIDMGISASYSLDFSPDNSKLVADGTGGTLRIYDVASGTLVQSIPGNMGTVFSVDYDPSGTLIAAGSQDNNVRIWNAADGTLAATLTGHTNDITSVKFSATGDHLVTASKNGQVKVWMHMMNMWMEHVAFTAPENVHQVDISDDEEYVIVGGFTQTYVYEAMTGDLVATFNVTAGGDVWSVDFQPGTHDAVTGTASGRVVYWALTDFLGVGEQDVIAFDVFPNPTVDAITVSLPTNTLRATADIFTTDGRLVHTTLISSAREVIDLRTLAAGDYVLRVSTDEGIGIRSIHKN
ncbi:MAG: T9SS type A sorting domain-containing protein [Flavobacteriales bacterium]|nr:T9SS type A sorting domain-containing protein [Flavobacteriales bacterium]